MKLYLLWIWLKNVWMVLLFNFKGWVYIVFLSGKILSFDFFLVIIVFLSWYLLVRILMSLDEMFFISVDDNEGLWKFLLISKVCVLLSVVVWVR